jgi:hypothetical protein
MVKVPRLKLVCERKISDLVPSRRSNERWEASGVLVKDHYFFVVFDDRTEIARIADGLQPDDTNGLFSRPHADYGDEGITYNAAMQRFYLLVEADWTWRNEGQLYEFPRSNDGAIRYGNIEGVAWITSTRIATVSDKRKKNNQSDKEHSEKDQSVHIFEIPP